MLWADIYCPELFSYMDRDFGFEIWNLFVIWYLRFVICGFALRITINFHPWAPIP